MSNGADTLYITDILQLINISDIPIYDIPDDYNRLRQLGKSHISSRHNLHQVEQLHSLLEFCSKNLGAPGGGGGGDFFW